MYAAVLKDSIEAEKKGIDYSYNNEDKIILSQLLKEINTCMSCDYHYLAELSFFRIDGIGKIVEQYIDMFQSETIRSILMCQMVNNKVENCAKRVFDLYLHFKDSKEYISAPNMPSPAHIYTKYDNVFKSLKPKKIQQELLDLLSNPRDAYYLPLTVRMLASWKIPELKEKLLEYLDGSNLNVESVGLFDECGDFFPSFECICRELKFIALDGLQYYPTKEVLEKISQYMCSEDADIRETTKKVVKKIKKKII